MKSEEKKKKKKKKKKKEEEKYSKIIMFIYIDRARKIINLKTNFFQ
jgi:hypothetical protein